MGQRDEKDKMKTRKEKLAGYFYDLSKLIFTAMVLGGMSSLYTGDCHTPYTLFLQELYSHILLHFVQTEF